VLARPDGFPDASFPEVEAPVLLRAGALLQAPTAWDASAFARRDAAADELHRELRRPSADAAEKLVGQARDVPALDALRRRSELRVAPAVGSIGSELYIPDAAQFVERSCAAREAQE
jgi:hypothetical protein